MLLEFKAKNYKSFKDETSFSLIPAPKQKGLDYSILKKKVGSKIHKGLCSAVIYGPNAAGKTNIIGAMEVFKAIALRGNIRNNDDDDNHPNTAVNALELIPNNLNQNNEPVEFSIKFIENNILFQYQLSIDIGTFLDSDYKRQVLFEELSVNEKMIYSRSEKLEFGDFDAIKEYLVNEFEGNIEGVKSIAKNNLVDEELFLTNGFKTMFSAKLVGIINNWLDNKFTIVYRANALKLTRKFSDSKKQRVYVEKTIDDAAKLFGINSNALGYMIREGESEAKLCSIFKDNKRSTAIPAEIFESYGTIRFVNMFPLVINVLQNGGTLIVDEFDASIHPMALISIINIFHNDDINTNKAQLVFNTHNPIFLNSNVFRRDELKFVERDDETNFSTHYSLSDFRTSGKNGVRLHEDYMKNYFVSQYGAIKDIDFTSIFESFLN
ncbi:ATP-binding protein [Herbivorax sp. ANBcel31]|uniref:AAA family ATPase n=1 Tax=Herbivorax sp. ANBcel31 TaxID=3069754 RepID=UPI0027ADD8ED|nr:ATP-binding protein [Herbivorax sp. ANBcel31]MDQ2087757.1 ATP-binding protein [Herbivorax sp. ANBcel31]